MTARATKLLHRAHIMTLATAAEERPWAAAVYYVPHQGGLYFFSKSSARHIAEGLDKPVAATIQEAPFHFNDIEGFQMEGTVQKAGIGKASSAAFTRYIRRFGFLDQLFTGEALKSLENFLKSEKKPSWYRFEPETVWFVDNKNGFGKRTTITIEDLFGL